MLKQLIIVILVGLLFAGCNPTNNKGTNNIANPITNDTLPPKGELAFLLNYGGQMPTDVGLLTNHVVERRLANMMKDSFEVFIKKAAYDRPIAVSEKNSLVAATFFANEDRTEPSALLIIDVKNDAFWATYYNDGTSVDFADRPSLPYPASFGE